MPAFRRRSASPNPPTLAAEHDLMLVAQAQHDPQVFGELYDRYLDAIYGYCILRLGSREAAEDATSVIFARALAGLARCQGPSFRAWLFGIAHHVVFDIYRSTRGDVPLDAAQGLDDPAASPEDVALANEAMHTLRAALARLSPDQRQVIELRLAGLSAAEIGVALGRTQGAVTVTQHRAMRRLRDVLTSNLRTPCKEVRHV